jgi:hypothetical protein
MLPAVMTPAPPLPASATDTEGLASMAANLDASGWTFFELDQIGAGFSWSS